MRQNSLRYWGAIFFTIIMSATTLYRNSDRLTWWYIVLVFVVWGVASWFLSKWLMRDMKQYLEGEEEIEYTNLHSNEVCICEHVAYYRGRAGKLFITNQRLLFVRWSGVVIDLPRDTIRLSETRGDKLLVYTTTKKRHKFLSKNGEWGDVSIP